MYIKNMYRARLAASFVLPQHFPLRWCIDFASGAARHESKNEKTSAKVLSAKQVSFFFNFVVVKPICCCVCAAIRVDSCCCAMRVCFLWLTQRCHEEMRRKISKRRTYADRRGSSRSIVGGSLNQVRTT